MVIAGFAKEQIRILAESRGILRVRGERLVTSNKWSRFEEEVVVPQDCNMSEIRAKFEGGILRITMPKKIITIDKKHPIEEQVQTTLHDIPRSSVTKPNVQQPRPQLESQEQPSKPASPIAQKPQFGTNINPPSMTHMRGEISEPQPKKPQEANLSSIKPQIALKESQNNEDNAKYGKEKFTKDDKPQVVDYEGGKNKGMTTGQIKDYETKEKSDQSVTKIQEKRDKYVDALDQVKTNDYELGKTNGFGNHMSVAKSHISKKLSSEDGQLLKNMGAAVLVIVALGTYISYSLGSID